MPNREFQQPSVVPKGGELNQVETRPAEGRNLAPGELDSGSRSPEAHTPVASQEVLTNLKKAWELLRAQVESVQNRVRHTQEPEAVTPVEQVTTQQKEADASSPEMRAEVTGLKQQLESATQAQQRLQAELATLQQQLQMARARVQQLQQELRLAEAQREDQLKRDHQHLRELAAMEQQLQIAHGQLREQKSQQEQFEIAARKEIEELRESASRQGPGLSPGDLDPALLARLNKFAQQIEQLEAELDGQLAVRKTGLLRRSLHFLGKAIGASAASNEVVNEPLPHQHRFRALWTEVMCERERAIRAEGEKLRSNLVSELADVRRQLEAAREAIIHKEERPANH
jgi:hypothetical protein